MPNPAPQHSQTSRPCLCGVKQETGSPVDGFLSPLVEHPVFHAPDLPPAWGGALGREINVSTARPRAVAARNNSMSYSTLRLPAFSCRACGLLLCSPWRPVPLPVVLFTLPDRAETGHPTGEPGCPALPMPAHIKPNRTSIMLPLVGEHLPDGNRHPPGMPPLNAARLKGAAWNHASIGQG